MQWDHNARPIVKVCEMRRPGTYWPQPEAARDDRILTSALPPGRPHVSGAPTPRSHVPRRFPMLHRLWSDQRSIPKVQWLRSDQLALTVHVEAGVTPLRSPAAT